jgi:hypothetical protein
MTPLNGGKGFTEAGLMRLAVKRVAKVRAGQALFTGAEDIHTIKVTEDTVLELHQYLDVMPVDMPTQLFTLDDKPPSLEGLYKKWDADQLRAYLWKLRQITALPIIE